MLAKLLAAAQHDLSFKLLDVALHLLRHYDGRRGSGLGDSYMALLDATGVWTLAPAAGAAAA